MKRYTFPVTLSGVGHDVDEAWRDAVEQFTLDPGEPDSAEVESGSGPFDEDDAEPIAKAEAPWPNDPPWMPEDAEASIAQGWSIFSTTGGRPFEIQSVADMPDGRDPVFESDKEAWAFVKAQAAAGDPLALKAKAFLQAHSPRECEVIFGQEGTAGEADIYQCQNGDWQGEGAVPAWDVEARHLPGDVFSDRECPEGGCLVHPVEEDENPKGTGEAEGQDGLVKLTLQLDVAYRPNGVLESDLRWYLEQIARRAAGEGMMTGESEAEVEEWRVKVLPAATATPVPRADAPQGKDSRLVGIVIYDHKHGRDVMACDGYQKAEAALAEIVRSQWKDRAAQDVSDDPDDLSDDEVIRLYFEGHDEEFYDIKEIEVDFED